MRGRIQWGTECLDIALQLFRRAISATATRSIASLCLRTSRIASRWAAATSALPGSWRQQRRGLAATRITPIYSGETTSPFDLHAACDSDRAARPGRLLDHLVGAAGYGSTTIRSRRAAR